MKKVFFLLLSLVGLAFLYSCKNCKHGYKNPITGSCYCDQGYTGSACDVSIVEKYAGVYNMTSSCSQSGNSSFTATLSGNASSSDIQIVPVYGANGVTGRIEDNSILFDGQMGGSPSIQVTGNGYIAENNNNTITLSLSVYNADSMSTETCTCTMVKQ